MPELTNTQIFEIVKSLAKKRNHIYESGNESYSETQEIANDLGFIDYDSMRPQEKIISSSDFLKIQDIYWIFLCQGLIAPGKNIRNPWFPNVHMTKYGDKVFSDDNLLDEFKEKYIE